LLGGGLARSVRSATSVKDACNFILPSGIQFVRHYESSMRLAQMIRKQRCDLLKAYVGQ
jgi:hypothetical protein